MVKHDVINVVVFILSVHKVREYRLLSGVVTRNEGVVEKGKHTDVSWNVKMQTVCNSTLSIM